jgi:mannose-1-phosphate guanylyltransferase/mannose-6-phosphate isomerase
VWIDAIGSLRRDILRRASAPTGRAGATARFVRVDAAAFESCPVDSIDYAVMERIIASPAPPEAVVVRLDAQWTDVGAWDALWQIGEKDARGNVVHGDVHLADTANALVVAQHRLVACVGSDDVVVVETPDAVMVARKDRAQAVGPLVARSRRRAGPRPSRTARCTAPGAPTTASKAASASR